MDRSANSKFNKLNLSVYIASALSGNPDFPPIQRQRPTGSHSAGKINKHTINPAGLEPFTSPETENEVTFRKAPR